MSNDLLYCPFCEDDDLIGLKRHLLYGWCEEFNKINITNSQGTDSYGEK